MNGDWGVDTLPWENLKHLPDVLFPGSYSSCDRHSFEKLKIMINATLSTSEAVMANSKPLRHPK